MKHVTPFTVTISAIAIAAIGFLFVHNTHMDVEFHTAIIAMVQVDGIPLTKGCQFNYDDPFYCGVDLPYRWLLAACIAAIVSALIWHEDRRR